MSGDESSTENREDEWQEEPGGDSSSSFVNLSEEELKYLIPHLIHGPSQKSSPKLPEPGVLQRLFPELEVMELLGAGGMGIVFKARQTKLDRLVAVKILNLALSDDAEFVARFEREARAMARLDHPNIVTIHDFGERDGFYYFIMEYVDGGDLQKLIQQKGAGLSAALDIIPQICEAVQFAHEQGITHRDIKPANILIDRKGRVKMADFGLAKILEGDGSSFQTMTGAGMGTPFFMAPEQVQDAENADRRADIYSLGVVIYQLLTGNLPQGDFLSPAKAVPGISSRMDSAIMRAMAQDPELRFSEVKEFFEALELVRGNRKSRISRSGVLAGMMLSALAVLAGVIFWQKPQAKSSLNPQANTEELIPDNLPPALAVMRERGGRLRGWGNTSTGAVAEILLEGVDWNNLVRVHGGTGGIIALDIDGYIRRGARWKWAEGVLAKDIDEPDLYVSSEMRVISNHPVLQKLARRIDKPIVSARSGGNRLAALASDGSVQLLFDESIERESHRNLARKLAAMDDVVAIEQSDGPGIGLRRDGTVFTWGDDTKPGTPARVTEAPETVRGIIAVQAGVTFLALDNKGKVHVWGGENHPLNGLNVAPDLGRAYQIRSSYYGVYAAQLSDGKWKAWGGAQTKIIDFINTEMGPAIDLDFAINKRQSCEAVWWIEPVDDDVIVTPNRDSQSLQMDSGEQ